MKSAARKKPAAPATPKLPAIGAPFAGGFFAGRFYDGDQPYALIVAPKADGERAETPWNKTLRAVKGALSYSDGPANTAAMAKAGSAIAQWARGLVIGGHKDWYIPSRLEALVLFGELRGVKAFDENATNGLAREWYWTSTQYAGGVASAWCQSFRTGLQGFTHECYELRARAVRRVAI